MKNKLLHFLLLSTLFLQCQNKNDEKKDILNSVTTKNKIEDPSMPNINKIQEILDKQKKLESEETEDDYNLTQSDLDILSDVLNQGLKDQGYKLISNEDFFYKINTIFNVNTNCNNCDDVGQRYFVYHGNIMDGKEETLNNNLYESFTETENLFFDKKNRLMTNFMFLKNVISVKENNYTINIPHAISARNKYLFNDSKADFAWLKFNDIPFLESLVKTFGYVKDKDLLTFVLKNNYKKEEELSKILWNKKCNGEITVNKEVFDLVKKWPTEDRHTFLMYALFVVQNMKKDFESDSEFNFSQKARLLGLISYYATQIGNIDNTYAYSFFPMLSGKNYDEEFKKNNYYNIPDFQEVYEEARTGGVNTDNWVQPDITKNDSHETINQYVDKVLRIYDRADFNSFSKEIKPKGEVEYVNKVNGWDFIKVDGTVGYIPTEEQKEAFANKPKRKNSFLADDEPEPMKKKGFWDSLFG